MAGFLARSFAAWLVLAVLLAPLFALALPGGDRRMATAPVAAAPAATGTTWTQSSEAFAWGKFGASLAVAAGAASLAVLVGGTLAAALALTDVPCRNLWAVLLLFPFLAPATVWTLGQTYCYGAGGLLEQWLGDGARPWLAWLDRGGYLGTTLALAEVHAPLALLILGRGMAGLPQAGLASARLYLTRARFIGWIADALRPELAASFLLTFALSLGNFTVPNVLQCRLFPIEIYQRLSNYLDSEGAVLWAGALLVPTLAATALSVTVERRRRYASAMAFHAWEPIELGRGKAPVAFGLGLYFALTAGLPVAAMVWQCRSPADFVAAMQRAAPETENTLVTALAAAGIAALSGAIVSAWFVRRGGALRELLTILPLGVPALILALGYSLFYNRTWPINLSAIGDAKTLVVLGLAARAWPFAAWLMADGRRRTAPELFETAQLVGLRGLRRWLWIDGPLISRHFFAGATLAFVLAMGEVEISQMLCAPGDGTLALRLFTFLHFGPVHEAASLAILQLLLTALPVLAYFLLTNRPLRIIPR